MTTPELIAIIKPLLERLRKYMKNKEVFDIVHQIEAHQKELEAKINEAETQLAELNDAHAAEIARLTQKHAAEIAKFKQRDEKAIWHGSDRPPIETRILSLIAANSALETDQIAALTGQGREAAKFHLDELFRANLIEWSTGQDFETFWHLKHEGRRYLIQRGLLK